MRCNIRPEERFDAILTKVEALRVPFWAHLDLTYRCNQKCIHCYCQGLDKSFSSSQKELTFPQVSSLLDDLADMGSLHLVFSGGEPFLREDFFDIAFYAKSKHFTIKIFTNGSLIDEQAAERLFKLAPLQIEMSIYGVTPEIHDSVTKKQGSFQKLLETVALLKKYNLRVELKSVLLKRNFHQAKDLERFSRSIGADDFRLGTDISPKNDGSRAPQQQQIDETQLRDFLSSQGNNFTGPPSEYLDRPLEKPLCQTGIVGCYVSPYGDVYPCIALLVPMGNIREKSFKRIWREPSALRDEIDSLKTYGDLPLCKDCQYVSFCNNCIGLTHLETGDMRGCYDTLKTASKIDYELFHKAEEKYG